MKTYSFFNKNIAKVALLLCCASATVAISSCEEEIDSSNFAIKKEQTVADILDTNKDLSKARELFKMVPLGNGSSIYSVLSARGNYTVFVPDNEAIDQYLKTQEVEDIYSLSAELAQLIAYSCVIDNGDQQAYESTEFPTNASFTLSNLFDRLLTCEEKDSVVKRVKYDDFTELPVLDENGEPVYTEHEVFYVIEKSSCVLSSDHEASNGRVHIVSDVIAPITDRMADAIKVAPNMQIMGLLLSRTGIDALLQVAERDMDYEEVEHPEVFKTTATFGKANIPLKRYIAFTGFVETDDIFMNYGVPAPQYADDEINSDKIVNADEIIAAVKSIPAIQTAYGVASDDLKDPNNAIYKFVLYHFINGKLAPGKFVPHNNEFRYDPGASQKEPQTSRLPLDVWDYHTTIGEQRSLMKILQKGDADIEGSEHPIYINRFCKYKNGFQDNYDVDYVINEGVEVFEQKAISPSNGYVYPISDLLLFGDAERNTMGLERMRIDFTTIFHEVLSNNFRGGAWTHFPQLSDSHTYFENLVRASTDTKLTYLHTSYGAGNWKDYQGDEFLAVGLFDFIVKLPPVPVEKEYELRIYSSHNAWRGMGQLYFGSHPDRLMPAGLPYDMRQSCVNNPAIPWVEDIEGDDLTNIENDKNLRNQGYMKAPNYFTVSGTKGATSVRNATPSSPGLRRIVTRQSMKPNETYYLRFKSALKKMDAEWFLDFIEIVPKEVYDGAVEEEIW